MKSIFCLAVILALGLATPAFAEEEDACAKPTKIHGFETCADIAKAEAEGEVVVYATNPEAAELRVLDEIHASGRRSAQLLEQPISADHERVIAVQQLPGLPFG